MSTIVVVVWAAPDDGLIMQHQKSDVISIIASGLEKTLMWLACI